MRFTRNALTCFPYLAGLPRCFFYVSPARRTSVCRGVPDQYGKQVSALRVKRMVATETSLFLYGKDQRLRYRYKVVLARFIKGATVRAVWCEFYDEKQEKWNKTRLLLSTNSELSAEEIIVAYAKRWSIESTFHELKNAWGVKEAWQQTRQTLNRWVQLTTIGYGLIQLLSLMPAEKLSCVMLQLPWRNKAEVTAGKIRDGLVKHFQRVNVLEWWSTTSNKIRPPS